MQFFGITSLMSVMGIVLSAISMVSAQPDQKIYLNKEGIIRWQESGEEVRLFGANYCAFSGSDYRVADRVGGDRVAMIKEDMAHFARMGWTGLRLCSWGDWEMADAEGNLLHNDHLDLMGRLIAEAKRRDLYMLFTPIHTYNPGWPDALDKSDEYTGFSGVYGRSDLGVVPEAIAAQANYVRQTLNFVNPYTGFALKDDPNILFVEMINEPVHHPEDFEGSVSYINALNDAVRSTGSKQITFHNYTQDMRIGKAIDASDVQGVSFGWYPSGLVSGRTLKGNFLPAVDDYPGMFADDVMGKPRIVYEFDQADLLTGYMYPAIARTYRSVGAQFAAIFAYDMLQSAPYNLGWQTHYVNLVHTPRKAMSGVIAAEVMRRLPSFENYGAYPVSNSFGDFRVSYEEDISELNATDAFMNAGDTNTKPKSPGTLERIAGNGSSPLIQYEGTGNYFLDKIKDGVWRLEVYPDNIHVEDPFAQPQPGRIVSRLYFRQWPMEIHLPDLGSRFTVTPLNTPQADGLRSITAKNSRFFVEPGVWLLSRKPEVDRAGLPSVVNRMGLDEFHINARQDYPDMALNLTNNVFEISEKPNIQIRLAAEKLPDDLELYLRRVGSGGYYHAGTLFRESGDRYAAELNMQAKQPGRYEFVVVSNADGQPRIFPGNIEGKPGEWPVSISDPWHFDVVTENALISLFDATTDHDQLSFVRPGESYRSSLAEIVAGEKDGELALSIGLPELGRDTPDQYAAALYIGDNISNRPSVNNARLLGLRGRRRGGEGGILEVLLIEKNGSSWSTQVPLSEHWDDAAIPLSSLQEDKSILIPSPFPGLWNYWRPHPLTEERSSLETENIERLEIRVQPSDGEQKSATFEISDIWLD